MSPAAGGGSVPSPAIVEVAWGRIEVEEPGGGRRAFKDAKLFPGGARAWDWNETGTRHTPGVQAADLEELLEHGARVVVVGRGVHERLGVTDEARRRLDDAGVVHEALATPDAVERYGELRREGRAVAALIHTTC